MGNRRIRMYHNPRCSKSSEALALLEQAGVDVDVVHYLEAQLSTQTLKELLTMLSMVPRDLMRKGESLYRDLGLDNPKLTEGDLIDAMVTNPILIERPIIVTEQGAVIGRPPERVLGLIDNS